MLSGPGSHDQSVLKVQAGPWLQNLQLFHVKTFLSPNFISTVAAARALSILSSPWAMTLASVSLPSSLAPCCHASTMLSHLG